MAETTAIEWTEATWNPWVGCRKVSQGCKHCYMFRDQERFGQDPTKVRQTAPATFRAPLKWKEPKLIFTCSWSDFFIEEADVWRPEAWELIRKTPQHTYQILTKRPERILANLPADWGRGYPNVWIGVTVEDQVAADKRIPLLLEVPTVVRFLSCEPMVGPVNLIQWLPRARYYLGKCGKCGFTATSEFFGFNSYGDDGDVTCPTCHHAEPDEIPGLHWVIAGGESGKDARPMHPDWARALRDQCQVAGVAFFFKQWGEWVPMTAEEAHREEACRLGFIDYGYMAPDGGHLPVPELGNRYGFCYGPAELEARGCAHIARVGKKVAGRVLDGRTWDEMPEVTR